MESNIMRMTLTNDCVVFYRDGVWVQPTLSEGFRFAGDASDLINILINHKDIDIENCAFFVRNRNMFDLPKLQQELMQVIFVRQLRKIRQMITLSLTELHNKGLVNNSSYSAVFTYCLVCKEYRWFKYVTDIRGLYGYTYCQKCQNYCGDEPKLGVK